MSKPSKTDLLKKFDEVVDLYKKELQKVDPKTKLPGVLMDKSELKKLGSLTGGGSSIAAGIAAAGGPKPPTQKSELQKGPNFNFKPGGAPSPKEFAGAMQQTFGSTTAQPTPPPPPPPPKPAEKHEAASVSNLKKEQHSDLSMKLKGALHKCGYTKMERNPALHKDGSIQAGIAAAGGGGNNPINSGVSSALGGAFGKKSK